MRDSFSSLSQSDWPTCFLGRLLCCLSSRLVDVRAQLRVAEADDLTQLLWTEGTVSLEGTTVYLGLLLGESWLFCTDVNDEQEGCEESRCLSEHWVPEEDLL